MKTVDFSETIAASDLKQMDLINICKYLRSRSFLTLAQGRVRTKIQSGFSQKLLCTLYESFQVQGNENLMT